MNSYNLSLPFDETYAWENFLKLVQELKESETLTFYGFGRKIKFKKLNNSRVLVTGVSLSEPEEINLNKQRKFEKVFMTEALKDPNRHLHSYERIERRHPDWTKQIYRCTASDCRHYCQAQFIINKNALCLTCGKICKIDRTQLKRQNKKLTGLCCSKSIRARIHQNASKIIRELEPSVLESEVTESKITLTPPENLKENENMLLDFLSQQHTED